MSEQDKLFAELEGIFAEKETYIKKLNQKVESLKVENEERRKRFIEDRQKSINKDNYINRLERRLIKIEQILNSRSLTRAEALLILRN